MATEDLTTYTKTDPNSRITVTTGKSSWVGLARNEDAYVYADKGVGHFSGDYEHLLEIYYDSSDNNGWAAPWVLTNLIDDNQGIEDAAGDLHTLIMYESSPGVYRLYVKETIAGTGYSDFYTLSLDTLYYLKVKRDESIGTYGTLYCYIYSDSARTNLLDTLSVTLHEKEDFRYIFATMTNNTSSAEVHTGYSQNLDLQEGITQAVGSGSIAIAGVLGRNIFIGVGAGSLAIAGALNAALTFFQAVGGGAIAIAGALGRVIKLAVGSGAVSIAGVLDLKTLISVGAGAVTSAATLGRKIVLAVGSGSIAIAGSLATDITSIFRQAVGGGTVAIAGALAHIRDKIHLTLQSRSLNLTLLSRIFSLTLPDRSLTLTLAGRSLTLTLKERTLSLKLRGRR